MKILFLPKITVSVAALMSIAATAYSLPAPLYWVGNGTDPTDAGSGIWNNLNNLWSTSPTTNVPAIWNSNIANFNGTVGGTVTTSVGTTVNVNDINFGPSAGAFTIVVPSGSHLYVNGVGITNNSAVAQSFTNNFDLAFAYNSTAGNATMTNNYHLGFYQNSTAGSATITNIGLTYFFASASGGTASLINSDPFSSFDISTLTIAGTTAGSIAGDGIFYLGSKNLEVGGNNTSTTFSGVIQDLGLFGGTGGSLTKVGTGTLILSGTNTYTGATAVNGGVLQIDGSIKSNTTVNAGGTLAGTGAIFANVINDAGVVNPGGAPNTAGTLYVGSNYTNNASGTFRAEIGGLAPGTTADLLNVNGDVYLNGGTLQVVRINNFMPMPGDRVTIINTLVFCTRFGTFDTVDPIGWNGLLQPMADYSNSVTVDVVFALANTFQSQGNTPNERATGRAVDSAVNDPNASALISFLEVEPLANLPADLDLIAPDELASIYEVGFSQAVVQNNNLQHRMDDIRAGSTGFSSAGYQAPISSKDGKNVISDKNATPAAFVAAPENRWGVFVTGNGDFVNVNDHDFNAPGYDISTGNVLLGVDYRIGNHIALGIDGSYASSTADLVNRGRVDVDGGKAGVYGTVYGFKILGADVHVDGAVGGGWNNYDTRRTGLQGLPVRGSTDGSELNALIAYGGDYHFGHLLVGTWSMVQYTDINLNSFTETGSLAPLRYPDQNQDSFRSTSGLRLAYEAKCGHMTIRPEVRVGWQHEGEERAYPITASFASGAGNLFTVHGPSIGRDSALVDAGVSVSCSDRYSAFVYYDGVLGRSNYDNHSISGGVRISF